MRLAWLLCVPGALTASCRVAVIFLDYFPVIAS